MNSIRSLERALDVRDRASDEGARGRRADRAGDPPLGRGRGRDRVDALQGGGVRLPVLPRARHPGARARGRVDRRDPRGAARAAASPPRALRGRARSASPRSRACWSPTGPSSELFEETVALGADPAAAANWVTQDVAGLVNKRGGDVAGSQITARHLADLIGLLDGRHDQRRRARSRRSRRRSRPATTIGAIVERRGLTQVSDSGRARRDRRRGDRREPEDASSSSASGKEGVIGFLVGQVMKKSEGSANPKLAQELLRERLSGLRRGACARRRRARRTAPRSGSLLLVGAGPRQRMARSSRSSGCGARPTRSTPTASAT